MGGIEFFKETPQEVLDLFKDWLTDEVKHEIYELEKVKESWRRYLQDKEEALQLKEAYINGEIHSLERLVDFLEGTVDRLYETR